MMDAPGGGSNGGFDFGGGGESWSKLTAGTGKWVKDNDSSFTITFTKKQEYSSYSCYELSISGSYSGSVYVKLNGASGTWGGNISSSKNFALGGASTDAGTLDFSSATKMSISGIPNSGKELNGSYTKK
jgi:hypothetical protein